MLSKPTTQFRFVKVIKEDSSKFWHYFVSSALSISIFIDKLPYSYSISAFHTVRENTYFVVEQQMWYKFSIIVFWFTVFGFFKFCRTFIALLLNFLYFKSSFFLA